jgi:hypothetical protein
VRLGPGPIYSQQPTLSIVPNSRWLPFAAGMVILEFLTGFGAALIGLVVAGVAFALMFVVLVRS